MSPKDGKKLIFLEPIHGHQTNTGGSPTPYQGASAARCSVTDDNEESNEIHTKRNSN